MLKLKKVYFSEQMSEETNAFTADVYFRGKKVGYAKNDGCGGDTYTHAYEGMQKLLQEASDYADTLPEIKTNFTNKDGSKFAFDSDLEAQVNELFGQWLEKKELTKNSNKGVIYEMPDGKRPIIYWQGWSIAKMKKLPQGRLMIQGALNKVKAKGGKVLNTNLQGFNF